ncbi:MAG: hypothetical protein IPO98_14670 [Saprospiraceae bacterium]|nr:hypothetical protein [Saprospiraceae bacterium]
MGKVLFKEIPDAMKDPERGGCLKGWVRLMNRFRNQYNTYNAISPYGSSFFGY